VHQKELESAAASAANALKLRVGSLNVHVIDSVELTSDVSDISDCDVVVGFAHHIEEGKIQLRYSLRSRGEFDCAAFCKRNGGGGHRGAAGFTVFDGDTPPVRELEKRLRWWTHT
jgi:nanoRNase/pAp phosphatase (c-di-AMP/oligoRNAs hydrolase)